MMSFDPKREDDSEPGQNTIEFSTDETPTKFEQLVANLAMPSYLFRL